jgi:hypothetical protein
MPIDYQLFSVGDIERAEGIKPGRLSHFLWRTGLGEQYPKIAGHYVIPECDLEDLKEALRQHGVIKPVDSDEQADGEAVEHA